MMHVIDWVPIGDPKEETVEVVKNKTKFEEHQKGVPFN